MANANNAAFSLITRLTAALEHPLIRRRNFGFSLNQPFSWSLINAASTFALLPVEDVDSEKGDALRVKLATLRHFNRLASGDNTITSAQIKDCLKLEAEIPLEQIKLAASDRVKVERRSGKLAAADVKARYTKLYLDMFEVAQAKHRHQKALANEIYFICNRSDEHLTTMSHPMSDEQLVDFDQYGYMIDSLNDRMTMPTIRACEEVQMVLDKSYRVDAIHQAEVLLAELTKIGAEIGISWDKLKVETAKINAELAAAMANDKTLDDDIDAELAEMGDLNTLAVPENKPAPVRTLVKSPERLAREAEDAHMTAVGQALLEAEAKAKAKAAKAAATRAANKAAKAATS